MVRRATSFAVIKVGSEQFALALMERSLPVAVMMTVRLWHVEAGKVLHSLTDHSDRVRALRFSPDDRILASAGVDQHIYLWNSTTGQLMQALRGHQDAVNSVHFHPDGSRLASGSADRTIRLWDIATGRTSIILMDTRPQSIQFVFRLMAALW